MGGADRQHNHCGQCSSAAGSGGRLKVLVSGPGGGGRGLAFWVPPHLYRIDAALQLCSLFMQIKIA